MKRYVPALPFQGAPMSVIARYSFVALFIFCLSGCGSDETQPNSNDESEQSDVEGSDTNTSDPAAEVLPNQFTIVTTMGTILVELDPVNAPITTANFEQYADDGFFDGRDGDGATTFHRVINNFMIQGGGYTESGSQKSTRSSIDIESDNGLTNDRGTLAMAVPTIPTAQPASSSSTTKTTAF